MEKINVEPDNGKLNADNFLELVNKIWPGKYDKSKTEKALMKTQNICAWDENQLIGCVRLLTDGYYFSTITEILVHPDFQKKGVGAQLMEMIFELSSSSLSFGVQPGNEGFFTKIGYERGLDSYQKKKERN